MLAPQRTQTRLDELEALLAQKNLSDDLRIISSVLLDVCKQLERVSEHDRLQDAMLRPEEDRRI